jgi:hypothetical protein
MRGSEPSEEFQIHQQPAKPKESTQEGERRKWEVVAANSV